LTKNAIGRLARLAVTDPYHDLPILPQSLAGRP
jgi:hypothetical protein